MSQKTPREPLGRVTSIKVKLGLVVAASVLVAAVLARLASGSVPALLAIPVTVALALGVTQLLAVGMTSPLRQMTEAARRMAAGDYAVRVRETSTDEVGQLARAFNTMAADLATVDRQRRDLVASVSHELRTPLTALVAVLENLDDGVTEPDPATIRVALGQAERLGDLVGDLLDLSRVDAGITPLERTEVRLQDLLEAVAAEASSAAPRRVAVEVRVEPPTLTAYADPARLHQLLANLLDNAVRHSPAGGTVRVWAGRAGDRTRLEVADEGPGIAPADRERVFERYGTLEDRGGDHGGGGTGLGLAIARWVTDLHGGLVAVVDPVAGERGARLRVELPPRDYAPTPPLTRPHPRQETAMSAPTAPPPTPGPPAPAAREVPTPSTLDAVFGSLWRERVVPARRGLFWACAAIGVLAGLTVVDERPGIAFALVLVASGVVVLRASRHRSRAFTRACAALCLGFAVLVVVRDAAWIVALGLLTSVVLVTSALTGARTAGGMLASAVAWPLAGLRGMPWLGRTLRAVSGGARSVAVVRTVVLSLVGVVVFGVLLGSADAVMGQWVDVLVPDLDDTLVLRVFSAVAVAGVVLAAAYLAMNPPGVETPAERRPAQHRFEWLAPVLLVDAVFAVFVVAQAAAYFGGHDYVRGVTGLTYAEYVHQGFAQMTVATALMLVVVWAAARKAGESGADRLWLRASLGALCLLTLVVVGSALYRMHLYQEAYGFTRLRLLVDVFEGWLGLVVVGVMAAGVVRRGGWLPRAALLSGAGLLLGLAAVNPDAWIARHNLDRYEASGRVDWDYLSGLSADAIPTLAALPAREATCALGDRLFYPPERDGWAGWNLSRARAFAALDTVQPVERVTCSEASAR